MMRDGLNLYGVRLLNLSSNRDPNDLRPSDYPRDQPRKRAILVHRQTNRRKRLYPNHSHQVTSYTVPF